MPAVFWETAQGGPGVLLAWEVGFSEGTMPPFFRRTIWRRHGPCVYEVQFSSLGKEGSAKTQCLLFLEGRFGEDTHSAWCYLRDGSRRSRHHSACCYVRDGSKRSRRPPHLGSRIQRRHSASFSQKDDLAKTWSLRLWGAILFTREGGVGEDTVPPFFRRTIR